MASTSTSTFPSYARTVYGLHGQIDDEATRLYFSVFRALIESVDLGLQWPPAPLFAEWRRCGISQAIAADLRNVEPARPGLARFTSIVVIDSAKFSSKLTRSTLS